MNSVNLLDSDTRLVGHRVDQIMGKWSFGRIDRDFSKSPSDVPDPVPVTRTGAMLSRLESQLSQYLLKLRTRQRRVLTAHQWTASLGVTQRQRQWLPICRCALWTLELCQKAAGDVRKVKTDVNTPSRFTGQQFVGVVSILTRKGVGHVGPDHCAIAMRQPEWRDTA
jgi:hypothetical protein